jgi:hypothetical protein
VARRCNRRPHPATASEKSCRSSARDPGCVKTLSGISAPVILSPVVTRRARKRKISDSARHYNQISFCFRTPKTRSGLAKPCQSTLIPATVITLPPRLRFCRGHSAAKSRAEIRSRARRHRRNNSMGLSESLQSGLRTPAWRSLAISRGRNGQPNRQCSLGGKRPHRDVRLRASN